MKEGYVVMNTSNCGNEIFGVYKSRARAEACLRRVIRSRFGHCPRDLDRLCEYGDINGPDSDDSYGLIWFEEFKGE